MFRTMDAMNATVMLWVALYDPVAGTGGSMHDAVVEMTILEDVSTEIYRKGGDNDFVQVAKPGEDSRFTLRVGDTLMFKWNNNEMTGRVSNMMEGRLSDGELGKLKIFLDSAFFAGEYDAFKSKVIDGAATFTLPYSANSLIQSRDQWDYEIVFRLYEAAHFLLPPSYHSINFPPSNKNAVMHNAIKSVLDASLRINTFMSWIKEVNNFTKSWYGKDVGELGTIDLQEQFDGGVTPHDAATYAGDMWERIHGPESPE